MDRQDDSRLGSRFSTSDKRVKCCVDDIALKHTCTCRGYVNIGVGVCVLLTLTTLAACWYTVVCSLQVKEQVLQLQRLQTFVHNSDIAFDDDTGETLHFLPGQSSGEEGRAVGVVPRPRRVRREADSDTKKPKKKRRKNQNGKNGKRGSRKGGGKFCNRIAKCQAPSSSPSSVTAPTPAKTHSLRASHFTVDGSTLSGQTIGSLHPARWVNAHVTPAAMSRDDSVSVVESGVYLVYTSVLFNDTKYREGLLVTRNDVELFKCFDGVDYIDHSKDRKQNFKFKTCSVSGITYLSKGDDLRMVNLYPNTNIDINEGSTFIGLVQLIPAIDPN